MKLINAGGAIDLGNGEIFAKGEQRSFSQDQAEDLMTRYSKVQKAASTASVQPEAETPAPKVAKPTPAKRGRPKGSKR